MGPRIFPVTRFASGLGPLRRSLSCFLLKWASRNFWSASTSLRMERVIRFPLLVSRVTCPLVRLEASAVTFDPEVEVQTRISVHSAPCIAPIRMRREQKNAFIQALYQGVFPGAIWLLRIRETASFISGALKVDEPATKAFAPAAMAIGAVSAPIPPSTSI